MRAKSHPAARALPSTSLHPRNRHQGRYDFAALIKDSPDLARFVAPNPNGDPSINFADPGAVKALNRALLKHHYRIANWDIPPGYLCPPIPGRADYLHNLADLLALSNGGRIPRGPGIRALDIGVGANCVYPLIGHAEYGWSFVGSDIDPAALASARAILSANRDFARVIELRRQPSSQALFANIIMAEEVFDLTLCNPPFHASLAQASAGAQRKWENLGRAQPEKNSPALNFGGKGRELWCPGGEESFVRRMIEQSAHIPERCFWFSSLISRSASLPGVYRALKRVGVQQSKTIEMAQGQKLSRLVAWSFLTEVQQQAWRESRWA